VKIGIHVSVILHVVLYGYESWSLILRKAHTMRACKNRMHRKTFGSEIEEAAGGCRPLHIEVDSLYKLFPK
jgi:hypothetical protein